MTKKTSKTDLGQGLPDPGAGKNDEAQKPRSVFSLSFEDPTSFREKLSWAMLGGLIISGILFLGVLWRIGELGAFADGFGQLERSDVATLLVLMTYMLVATAIVGAIVSALMNPSDAGEPQDDREKQIVGKAAIVSGHIMTLFLFGALGLYFSEASPSLIACGIIFAVWAGMFVNYLSRCILYRIG